MPRVARLAPERLSALAWAYERLFRARTPARTPRHVLAGQRVNFSDLSNWHHQTYGEHLAASDRIDLAPILKPLIARLRREFPDERWD